MNPLRQIVKSLMTTCLPSQVLLDRGRQRHDQRPAPGGRRQPAISLTFDDGPDLVHTPAVLDALQAAGLTGTFFVVGERAAAAPDLVRRIVAEGHMIGNHTWSHREPRTCSPADFLQEVARTREFLADLTGITTHLVRPPKGELTWGKFIGLARTGQTVVLWNVDSRDYAWTAQPSLALWTARYQPAAGDIVLFHDNHPHAAQIIRDWHASQHLAGFETTAVSVWVPARDSSVRPATSVAKEHHRDATR